MSAFLCSPLDQFDQLAATDHINSCRNRIIGRNYRFLLKFLYSTVIIHPKHAKTFYLLLILTGSAYYCNICTFGYMELQDFVVIHFVDTVTGCDHNIWLMTLFQEINILVNRICCSLIPETVVLGYGRRKYKKSALLTSKVPPLGGT